MTFCKKERKNLLAKITNKLNKFSLRNSQAWRQDITLQHCAEYFHRKMAELPTYI